MGRCSNEYEVSSMQWVVGYSEWHAVLPAPELVSDPLDHIMKRLGLSSHLSNFCTDHLRRGWGGWGRCEVERGKAGRNGADKGGG